MSKTLVGKVTSDAADKTITVTVTSRETHPVYKKQYTVNRKYKAHDETNDARVGDTVQIVSTRPISKDKSFKLEKVIERGQSIIDVKDDTEEVLGEEAA